MERFTEEGWVATHFVCDHQRHYPEDAFGEVQPEGWFLACVECGAEARYARGPLPKPALATVSVLKHHEGCDTELAVAVFEAAA